MEATGNVSARAMALAGTQCGLLTTQQCRELGMPMSTVSQRVRFGVWRRLHRGCIVVTPGPITVPQREVAAWLLGGEDACLSHFTAARRLGISVPKTKKIFITIPRRRMALGAPLATVFRSDLERGDLIFRNGVLLTRTALALLQSASLLDPPLLRVAVDSAMRISRSNLKWMQDVMRRYSRFHGVANLRAVLAQYSQDMEIPDSEFESFAQALCFVSGKRPILHQVVLDARGQFIAKVDYAWPEVRLAIELDSWQHHAAQRADFEQTQIRRRRLELGGWEVHAYGYNDLMKRRDQMIAELAEFYRRREQLLLSSGTQRQSAGR